MPRADIAAPQPTSERTAILNGTRITPFRVEPNADGLWIEAGRWISPPDSRSGWRIVDASGLYIAPGFIDVHIHGGAGSDFMDGAASDAQRIAGYHATGGTTSLLATTGADSLGGFMRTMDSVAEAMASGAGGARLLGVHVEGPYFSPAKRGCHLARYIRAPRPDDYMPLLERDEVRWMTLAPELPGSEGLIRALTERGIVASAGHSEATYPQVEEAVGWGLRHSTHLYNAMSSVTKRGPARIGGLVEASLLLDGMTTELIADGHHVPDELMRLAVRCKGVDGVLIVTDAQRAAGMPDGEYEFGRRGEGVPFVVRNGVAMMPDASGYASSTIRMIDAVRVAHERIGVGIAEAVRMASHNPARRLGLEVELGSLEPGKRADAVLFSPEWEVVQTLVDGSEVYRRS